MLLDKFQQYRHAVKSIRDREEKLSDAREKKRSLQSRIANLSKTSPRSPKLAEFQKELKSLAHDTHESELDLADFKRFAIKEAFYLRFNAMNEYAEKTALIAGFGKYLTDLIDIEPTPSTQSTRNPYEKGPEAAVIFADAIDAVDNWKPMAEDERPTLANDAMAAGKGKEPEGITNQPPKLPPRKASSVEETMTHPTGYTPDEVSQATGDLKTSHETEVDLDKLDLYDAPPPAYDGPPPRPAHQSSPLNSDQPIIQDSGYSFSSPYQSNATLPPAPQPPHQYCNHPVFESPVPMHQQSPYGSPYPKHNNNPYLHQESTYYDQTGMLYNTQVNYQQLYRQVSQRRQPAAYRPYSEFQQQFNHNQNDGNNNLRQKVDAGGFRIPAPAPTHDTAEDEKEKLAQYYRQQDEQQQYNVPHYDQYGNVVSPYDGPHHTPSQYGGSQYEGSQYGQSQYAHSQYEGSLYGGQQDYQQTPTQQHQQLQSQNSVHQPTSPPPGVIQDPNPTTTTTTNNITQELHKPNYEQKIQEEE